MDALSFAAAPPLPDHEAVDPAILYWGTPVVLVGTTNPDGGANLAPISSAFWLGHRAVLGFGLSSHTVTNLRRTGECTLNLPDVGLVDAVDRLALTTGTPDPAPWKRAAGYVHVADKFAHAGLTPLASRLVGPPGARECPAVMEAKVASVHTTDLHLVTVDVVKVHVHPAIRLHPDTQRIDPDAWRPLVMSFQRFYGLGPEVHPSRLASIPEEHYR